LDRKLYYGGERYGAPSGAPLYLGFGEGRSVSSDASALMRISAPAQQARPWYLVRSGEWDARIAAAPADLRQPLRAFLEDGIATLPSSLSPDHVDDLARRFRTFEAANDHIFRKHRDTDGHYPRIVNLHLSFPDLLELFTLNIRALRLMDGMFGSETVIYTSLFYERGSAQDIHRDTPYFATKPDYLYFGVWVALEDTDESNGPLQVVRKGHLLDELNVREIAARHVKDPTEINPSSPELWDDYQRRVQEQCFAGGLTVEPVTVKKGDTIIWHPKTPHGGAPILDSSRTRLSFVMHVTPHGVPVYHQDVFFNPDREVSYAANWVYREAGGRKYADFPVTNFGHRFDYRPAEFLT
jgi:phytanoyl-CoA hydroxylase